jgi:hypothetical protein
MTPSSPRSSRTGKTPGLKQLEDWARKKLRESGLSAEHGKLMRLEYSLAEESANLLPNWGSKAGPGILIPYFDITGHRNGFFRFRRRDFTPDARVPKYLQPSGSATHPYLVPGQFRWHGIVPLDSASTPSSFEKVRELTWKEIASDPRVSIGLTEGELKSACCTLLTGFPVIGLGGVWAFQAKKQGVWWLPELDEFDWKGRHVPVIFDYSQTFNPHVTQALFALAMELTNRGAHPYIVTLPGPEKGIDDYLVAAVARGSSYWDAMSALLSDKRFCLPWAAARELWEMNARYVYVENPPGYIYRPEIDQFLSSHALVTDYGNRSVTVPKVNKKGEIIYQRVSAPEAWLRWLQRATASRLAFDPGSQPGVYLEDGSLNIWKGFTVEPKEDPEGIKEWEALLDYMFQPPAGATDEVRRRYRSYQTWFECWLAKPFQQPGFHLLTAVVLISEVTGVGKSILGNAVGALYGKDRYYSCIDNRDLSDPRNNNWMRHVLFVQADDIDRRTREERAAQLKVYITEKTVRISEKYQPVFTADNHANLLFTTNDIDAFEVDYNDRRYAMFRLEAPENLVAHKDWGQKRVAAWVEYFASERGKQALMYWMLNYKIPRDWNHQVPPATEARFEAQEATTSSGEVWVRKARELPETYCGRDSAGRRLWTAEDVLTALTYWPQYYEQRKYQDVKEATVSRWMRKGGWLQLHGGAQIHVHKAGYEKVRLWCRTQEDFEELNAKSPSTLKHMFLAERGGRKKKKFVSTK